MSSHLMKIVTAEKDLCMSPKQSYHECPLDCKVKTVNPMEFCSVIESQDSKLGDPSCTVYTPKSTNRKDIDCWDLNGLLDSLDSYTVNSHGDHNRNLIGSLQSSTEYSPGYVKTSNILEYNPTVIEYNPSNDYSPGSVDTSDVPEYNTSTEDSPGYVKTSNIVEYNHTVIKYNTSNEYDPGFVDTPDIPEYIPTKIKYNTSPENSPVSVDSSDIPMYNPTKIENDNCECILCENLISTAEYDYNGGICVACSTLLTKMKKRKPSGSEFSPDSHRLCPLTSSCSHESYHLNPPKRMCIRSQVPSYT